jgi:membrane protease YdiL (CAAX protease family)
MNKKNRLLLLSIGSIPIAWGVLQCYHLICCRPIVKWILSTFPQSFENLQMPYPFVASMLNLTIFGIMAAFWPHLGFGYSWKPDRYQCFVVLSLISAAMIYPSLNTFLESVVTPVKDMGFVTWTITPVQEEIIFRGFLYAFLLRIFKRTSDSSFREVLPVLVLGAVWFSLWHLSPHAIMKYGWGVVGTQVVLTFFAGIIFNGLRHWTGSIWLVIPVHAAGNFMVSVM